MIANAVNTQSNGADFSVLVVDDNIDVADALADFLVISGMNARAVHSVADARCAIAGDPAITVTVAGLRMPDKNGLELAIYLNESRAPSEAVSVVMMTGNPSNASAFAAGRNNIFAFFKKPLRPLHLAEVVRKANLAAIASRAQGHIGDQQTGDQTPG